MTEPTEFFDRFGAVRKCVTALAGSAYAGLEVGSMQAKLVRHIGMHARISQAELARATSSDPTLTGRVLATLIERGLVRRERSDEDRREYMLELSAEGRRLKTRIDKLRSQLAAQIVGVLDARDLADFERIANKILGAFGDATE